MEPHRVVALLVVIISVLGVVFFVFYLGGAFIYGTLDKIYGRQQNEATIKCGFFEGELKNISDSYERLSQAFEAYRATCAPAK